ncbi:MAG: hypothetical protein AUI14_12525 [Actinobacteria bacterium 13_2_20CM_2_71_6]|nr:MAG: hypothetical protein AUI14_12525 [Actinobacteria bacterium 13_2_20CM_2_71_6]
MRVPRRPALPVALLLAGQFAALPLGHLAQRIGPDMHAADHVLVEHHHPARRDRPRGQLVVSGNAEPAHHEYVERRTQRPGYFVSHRHAARR